jgi:exopolyphosphatase/guanosine-5'-triphosphate,3'-diphosphate pyrophosphatase
MPLYASIDVGSNTLRLLIGNVKDSRIGEVLYKRRITRLSEGVDQTGRLQEQSIEASLSALREFSSLISKHGVEDVRAVATSALREASNSHIFVEKVFTDTGIPIEVISGEKEAGLTLKGVLSSLPDPVFRIPYSAFIVDIGGGSTEWILYKDKNFVDMGSIPVGVVKFAGSFIKTDPVSDADIKRLDNEIVSFLEDLKIRIGQYIEKDTKFIGTAGTFSTIASIDIGLNTYSREKIHLHRLALNRLQDMNKKLLALPLKERKNIRGLEPERADLIIPGLQFTIKVLEIFGFDELIVSDYGLLEGILLEINEKNIPETGKP